MYFMHWLCRKSRCDIDFTADDVMKTDINDVSLCKLDVNVKNRTESLVALASLNLRRNSLKENVLLCTTSKIKCDISKGMQEKVSIMGVWCG